MHGKLTVKTPLVTVALTLLLVVVCVFSRMTDVALADLTSGFSHPLEGWDHIVTMLGVGIWAAQLRGKSIWLLPLTFVGVMSLGGISGAAKYLAVPSAELLILLSCLVFSALIIRKIRFNTQINVLIVAFFAFFHGYAHGQEISASASLLSYTLGFMLATLLLHGTGILVTKVILLAVTFLIASFSHAHSAQKNTDRLQATLSPLVVQCDAESLTTQSNKMDRLQPAPPWITIHLRAAAPLTPLHQLLQHRWLDFVLMQTGLAHLKNGVGLTSPPWALAYFVLASLISAFVVSAFFCYVFYPSDARAVLAPCFSLATRFAPDAIFTLTPTRVNLLSLIQHINTHAYTRRVRCRAP